MALVESLASDAVFAILDAGQDYGDAGAPQIASARAQLRVIADAFAKCIPHLVTNAVVSTTDTCSVSGAVPSPPSAGAVAGSGSGTVGGLVKGTAEASTGLAGAIQAVLVAGIPGGGGTAPSEQLAVLANACAEFATYVMGNAQVSTTVTGVATTLGVNGATTGTGTGSIS